ncbi:MAG TPA: ribosome silencing factor [bacterium]
MARELALQIAELGWQKKAESVVILDVSAVTQFTDYFVLMTGEVDQHLRAICAHIEDSLKSAGTRAHHIEGRLQLQWILMDYVDVIVHLFLPSSREFYDLESLWGDAKPVSLKLLKAASIAASAASKTTKPRRRASRQNTLPP